MDKGTFDERVKWVRERYHLPMLEQLHDRDRAVRDARAIQEGSLDINDAGPEGASLYLQWMALETGDKKGAAYLRRKLRRPKPPGAPAKTGRDRAFILAIEDVKDYYELPVTRSTPDGPSECCAAGGSACDVVGAALPGKIQGGRRRFLSYSTVKGIWGKRTRKPGE